MLSVSQDIYSRTHYTHTHTHTRAHTHKYDAGEDTSSHVDDIDFQETFISKSKSLIHKSPYITKAFVKNN